MQRFKDIGTTLGGFTDDWFGGFPFTKQRLLSFNYDRIPELALLRFSSAAAGQPHSLDMRTRCIEHWVELPRRMRICSIKIWSYLKLHGSIGIEPLGEDEN